VYIFSAGGEKIIIPLAGWVLVVRFFAGRSNARYLFSVERLKQ
jgi:hypothetical protein